MKKPKNKLEEKTFKIIHVPMIITETEKGYEYQTPRAYIDSYKHIQYLGTDKKGNECFKSFVFDWLNDANTRRYDYIVFKPPPLKVNGNEYNTWENFKIADEPLIKTERNYWE